jgi:hypothetical protein
LLNPAWSGRAGCMAHQRRTIAFLGERLIYAPADAIIRRFDPTNYVRGIDISHKISSLSTQPSIIPASTPRGRADGTEGTLPLVEAPTRIRRSDHREHTHRRTSSPRVWNHRRDAGAVDDNISRVSPHPLRMTQLFCAPALDTSIAPASTSDTPSRTLPRVNFCEVVAGIFLAYIGRFALEDQPSAPRRYELPTHRGLQRTAVRLKREMR